MFLAPIASQFSPMTSVFTPSQIPLAGNASSFTLAGNAHALTGWNTAAAHSIIASKAAANAFASIGRTTSDSSIDAHNLAGMVAVGYEPEMTEGLAAWLPGLSFSSAFLCVVGLVFFDKLFGGRKASRKAKAEELPVSERPTVPVDSLEDTSTRPTVAGTPPALAKKIRFGVRIGGEFIPGASIPPPPPHADKRGDRGGTGLM